MQATGVNRSATKPALKPEITHFSRPQPVADPISTDCQPRKRLHEKTPEKRQMIEKIIGWLKNKLFGAAKYIKIAATETYLRIKGKVAELIPEKKVPKRNQTNPSKNRISRHTKDTLWDPYNQRREREGNNPVDQSMREGRKSTLENLHSEEVARRASRNTQVREDVLMNPELIDADSEWEAEVKIDLAQGKDITPFLEANPQLDVDTVMDKIGTEWAARAGQNQMGTQQMLDVLNSTNSVSSEGTDADVDTDATGETGGGAETGAPASAMHGGSLPGVDSIDVSTGSTSSSSSAGSSGVVDVGSPQPSPDIGGGDIGGGDVGGGDV